ncbi:molybdate ABC transporter substrate-binding protein [Pseudoalteromonas gelatinilytica]
MKLLVIVLGIVGSVSYSFAGMLNVASASNFKPALEKIASSFSQTTGHKVHITYGSSGKLFSQIKHGAPYDLFLSADKQKPTRLVQSGYSKLTFQRTYAVGRLALWSNKPSIKLQNGNVLISEKLATLALADSKLAPYGLASEQVLVNLSVYQLIRNKRIVAHSAIQVFHFVSLGNVDVGFVPVSHLISQGIEFDERVWVVPELLHDPVLQDMVLLNKAHDNPAAIQFWHFIQSEQAKAIISSYGYEILE